MEKVVYILGAGFSAPLGLPIMANFIERSRDLYFLDSDRFSNFREIFRFLHEMSSTLLTFSADLHNIEEVLSILEMQQRMGDTSSLSRDFRRYLGDVVRALTPDIGQKETGAAIESIHWPSALLGVGNLNLFGRFFASLFPVTLRDKEKRVVFSLDKDVDTSYSIVSLNYDCIPEMFLSRLRSGVEASDGNLESLSFKRPERPGEEVDTNDPRTVVLAKLHGSVDSDVVVPPTWNKALREEILPQWQMAFKLLSTANHIRVLGYSLPETDSYVRFLLKASRIEAKELSHLKTFHVICLDDAKSSVRRRYRDFVTHPGFEFYNASVLQYFGRIEWQEKLIGGGGNFKSAGRLEDAHRSFAEWS